MFLLSTEISSLLSSVVLAGHLFSHVKGGGSVSTFSTSCVAVRIPHVEIAPSVSIYHIPYTVTPHVTFIPFLLPLHL